MSGDMSDVRGVPFEPICHFYRVMTAYAEVKNWIWLLDSLATLRVSVVPPVCPTEGLSWAGPRDPGAWNRILWILAMPLEKPLEQLTETDLQALVADKYAERRTIEYKESLHEHSDGEEGVPRGRVLVCKRKWRAHPLRSQGKVR